MIECEECEKKDKRIAELTQEIDDKDDEISELQQDIEDEHGGGDYNEE